MDLAIKKIAGALIIIIGLILFFFCLLYYNINLALICLTLTLILWVLYGLFFDSFDINLFTWIISSSGFLIAITVFFNFGITQKAYPVGAIVFNSGGIAGALGIGFFSLLPILVMHQLNSNNKPKKPNLVISDKVNSNKTELEGDDWEIASDEDINSDKFDI